MENSNPFLSAKKMKLITTYLFCMISSPAQLLIHFLRLIVVVVAVAAVVVVVTQNQQDTKDQIRKGERQRRTFVTN
jgi:hypothetical protein